MSTAEKECRRIHKGHEPIGDHLIERHFELVVQARENGGIIGYDSKWITGVVTQLCIDLVDARAELAHKKDCISAMAETCAKDKKEIEELRRQLAPKPDHYPWEID